MKTCQLRPLSQPHDRSAAWPIFQNKSRGRLPMLTDFSALIVWFASVGSGGGVVDRKLPPSSRHHESGVWQGLYRLEVEVVWILRGATGR